VSSSRSTAHAVTWLLVLFFSSSSLLSTTSTTVSAIYPPDHFNHVVKITEEEQLQDLIETTLAADQTLFVRWIASEG